MMKDYRAKARGPGRDQEGEQIDMWVKEQVS
jgi:hypothetical protein